MNTERFSPKPEIAEGVKSDQILIGTNEIIHTRPGSIWHPKPERPAPKPGK